MNTVVALKKQKPPASVPATDREYLTFYVGGQLFGVPVLTVRDVLKPQTLTRIPLAPAEVAGSINLRGRIITVIDVNRRLGLASAAEDGRRMNVVVGHGDELYSLMVDKVGEVLGLSAETFEHNPSTLDSRWREFSDGVYLLEQNLLVVLNVAKLLAIEAD